MEGCAMGQVLHGIARTTGAARRAILLRNAWRAAGSSGGFRHRIQFRSAAQDPQRPHPIRIHLQALDERARQIQTRSAPSNAGTKYRANSAAVNAAPRPQRFDHQSEARFWHVNEATELFSLCCNAIYFLTYLCGAYKQYTRN